MILITGAIAIDDLETPHGAKKGVIGGSGMYFSLAANLITEVALVGVVGNDYPPKFLKKLSDKNIDVSGVKRMEGKSFYWKGHYKDDMSIAYTDKTEVGVFENFEPKLSATHKKAPYVFLANIDPEVQFKVYQQLEQVQISGLDSMNFWMDLKLNSLWKILKKIDLLFLNSDEIKQLAEETSLIKAGRKILKKGAKFLIIKKGEDGVLVMSNDFMFTSPAYPTEKVKDPTGAGDSFAGGVMSYLAYRKSSKQIQPEDLKQAIVWGSALASFTVESFSVSGIEKLTAEKVKERCHKIYSMTTFLKH